jgi:dihydrofolate reductase
MIVSAIAAVSENGIIGRKGELPWHLPDDLKFFQRTTLGHHVIMGRKNWDSIPLKYRPLKGRVNVVISRQTGLKADGATVVPSLAAALGLAEKAGDQEAFVIGGGEIFRLAFGDGLIDRVYLTRVHAQVDGDVRFGELGDGWKVVWTEFHGADERHEHAFTIERLERGT